MVEIAPATLRDVTWIAAHMREQDRREILAVHPGPLAGIAVGLTLSSKGAWCAWIGGEPVAALGITELLPGVGSGWAFGTERMRRAIPELTRFAVGHVKPWLLAAGFRRVEVRTAVDHDLSHKWLAGMGFEREGLCKAFGNDLDYWLYASTGN